MSNVLIGSAIINPDNPKRLPHIDSDNNIIAGCNPVTLFMIFGMRIISWINCIIINTIAVEPRESHILCSVSMLCSMQRIKAGIKPSICM